MNGIKLSISPQVRIADLFCFIQVRVCACILCQGRELLGGYGKLIFDEDEHKDEQWEVKCLGYVRLRKVRDIILAETEEGPGP